jgi:hypothetical protein
MSKIFFYIYLRKNNKYLFVAPDYRFNMNNNFQLYFYINFIFKILNYFNEKKFQ